MVGRNGSCSREDWQLQPGGGPGLEGRTDGKCSDEGTYEASAPLDHSPSLHTPSLPSGAACQPQPGGAGAAGQPSGSHSSPPADAGLAAEARRWRTETGVGEKGVGVGSRGGGSVTTLAHGLDLKDLACMRNPGGLAGMRVRAPGSCGSSHTFQPQRARWQVRPGRGDASSAPGWADEGGGGQDARLLLGVRWGRRGGGQGVRLRSARSAPRAGHVRRARPDKICLPAEHAEHVP